MSSGISRGSASCKKAGMGSLTEFAGRAVLTRIGKSRWTIRGLLLGLVLACLLPGVLGVVLLLAWEYREGRSELEQHTLQTARALLQAVDNQIFQVKALAHGLATADSLARGDLAAFHAQARQTLGQADLGLGVVLIDRSGQQRVNTLREFGEPLPLAANSPLVRQVFETGQPVVSDLYIGEVIGQPIMTVAIPVIIRNDTAYVLIAPILADQFNAILVAQGLPPGWIAAVLDSTGTIVARTHAAAELTGKKAAPEFLKAYHAASEGSLETPSRDGIPVVSVFARSATTRWGVGLGIPREIFESQLRNTFSVLALGVAALFGAGLGLAWFMGNRIARSFRQLRGCALAVAAGDELSPPRLEVKEAAELACVLAHAGQLLKERQTALVESRAGFKAIFEQAAVGIARVALDGHWLEVNDKLCATLGYAREELLRLRFQEITYGPDLEADLLLAERLKAGCEANYSLEKRYIRKEGSLVWTRLTASLVRTAAGEPDYFVSVVEDIQARKDTEMALEQARQNHLQRLEQQVAERTAALREARDQLELRVAARTEEVRRLAAELTFAEERERQALARDLHDDLGQLLHVIRINLGLLGKKRLSAQAGILVNETSALVAEASSKVRSLTSQLSPPILSTLGLPAALEWLSGEVRQTYGLAVDCRLDAGHCAISVVQSSILFRAARELLINVARHSGAKHAVLELSCDEESLSMTVADAGVGMQAPDNALAGTRGFGLASVRERISFLGGKLLIRSSPGDGTQIVIQVPVELEPESAGG